MSRRRCKSLQRIVAYLRVYLPSLPFLLPHAWPWSAIWILRHPENNRSQTRCGCNTSDPTPFRAPQALISSILDLLDPKQQRFCFGGDAWFGKVVVFFQHCASVL